MSRGRRKSRGKMIDKAPAAALVVFATTPHTQENTVLIASSRVTSLPPCRNINPCAGMMRGIFLSALSGSVRSVHSQAETTQGTVDTHVVSRVIPIPSPAHPVASPPQKTNGQALSAQNTCCHPSRRRSAGFPDRFGKMDKRENRNGKSCPNPNTRRR